MTLDILPDIRAIDIPAWYNFGITSDNKALLISIGKTALEEMRECLTLEDPVVKSYEEEFNNTPLFGPLFISPTEKIWGFGEILEQIAEDDNWTTYRCNFPIILSAEEVERHTDAEGHLDFSAERNREEAERVAITLSELFKTLWRFEKQAAKKEDTGDFFQLLVIENMLVESGLHGSEFSVKLSKRFCIWLERQIEDKEYRELEVETEKAMREAHFQMWQIPLSKSKQREHKVECHPPKSIHLSCPGNGCGLDPEYRRREDWGYMLHPHNVDSRLQQLTLLAGIAKLHQLARQDRY